MQPSRRVSVVVVLALALLAAPRQASGIPGTYTFVDDPRCDPHAITLEHELGEAPAFPIDELISATSFGLELPLTCTTPVPPPPEPIVPNDFIVTITNLSPFSWVHLFFVADAGIMVGNADGKIIDGDAFKIDKTGVNAPLLSESIASDLVFSPGESWTFIVQDQFPPFLPPDLMGSIGVGSKSDDTTGVSWASIVAIRVPEPDTLALMALAVPVLVAILRRKR